MVLCVLVQALNENKVDQNKEKPITASTCIKRATKIKQINTNIESINGSNWITLTRTLIKKTKQQLSLIDNKSCKEKLLYFE